MESSIIDIENGDGLDFTIRGFLLIQVMWACGLVFGSGLVYARSAGPRLAGCV